MFLFRNISLNGPKPGDHLIRKSHLDTVVLAAWTNFWNLNLESPPNWSVQYPQKHIVMNSKTPWQSSVTLRIEIINFVLLETNVFLPLFFLKSLLLSKLFHFSWYLRNQSFGSLEAFSFLRNIAQTYIDSVNIQNTFWLIQIKLFFIALKTIQFTHLFLSSNIPSWKLRIHEIMWMLLWGSYTPSPKPWEVSDFKKYPITFRTLRCGTPLSLCVKINGRCLAY